VVLLLALLALFGVGLGFGSGSTEEAPPRASTAPAQLRIVSTSPLVVGGLGFSPRERVRLTATGDRVRTRTVTASSRGTFRVVFRLRAADPCAAGIAVSARGSTHAATVKLPPRECAMP
jgi:hypothetical protein